MDGSCPCFASGTPLQFENLCKIFVNLSFNKKLIHGLRVSIPQSIITFPRVGIRFYSFEVGKNKKSAAAYYVIQGRL